LSDNSRLYSAAMTLFSVFKIRLEGCPSLRTALHSSGLVLRQLCTGTRSALPHPGLENVRNGSRRTLESAFIGIACPRRHPEAVETSAAGGLPGVRAGRTTLAVCSGDSDFVATSRNLRGAWGSLLVFLYPHRFLSLS